MLLPMRKGVGSGRPNAYPSPGTLVGVFPNVDGFYHDAAVLVIGVKLADDRPAGTDASVADGVLRRAEQEVRGAIKKFQTPQAGSLLEARIIAELSAGRRSIAELTCQIFETNRDKPEYAASYDRVRRALRILEGRGYVSHRLFGKERPYTLTQLALTNLLRLDSVKPPRRWFDYAAFSGFITLAAITLALANGKAAANLFLAAYSGFLILAGVSMTRMLQILRQVM